MALQIGQKVRSQINDRYIGEIIDVRSEKYYKQTTITYYQVKWTFGGLMGPGEKSPTITDLHFEKELRLIDG